MATKKSRANGDGSASSVPFSEERQTLANDALWEITKISITLRDYISKNDETGRINPLARGMLARVQLLSEVASECIGCGDDWTSQQLEAIVGCTSAFDTTMSGKAQADCASEVSDV